MSIQYHNTADLTDALTVAFAPTSLTTQLTTVTHHAPTTPDYAIAALTTTTPYGFASQDEGETVLKVIANLQVRLAEVEAQLKVANILV